MTEQDASFDNYDAWFTHCETYGQVPAIQKYNVTKLKFEVCIELARKIRTKSTQIELELGEHTFCPPLQEEFNNLKTLKERIKPFWFITISPEEGNWQEAFDRICGVKDLMWCDDIKFVVEQRGTTAKDIHGVHFHILINKYNIKPSTLKKYFLDHYRDLCKPDKFGKYNHVINCLSKKRQYYEDKLDYITGRKVGEGKEDKQKIDLIFREKFSLENFYDLSNIPTRYSNNHGGARAKSGVKLGTKRGPYKKKEKPEKQKNIVSTCNSVSTEVESFHSTPKTLTF